MIRIMLSTRLGERRWTQADLSRITGIRPNTISAMYNELMDRVSLQQIDRICEVLGCDVCDILTYDNERIDQTVKAQWKHGVIEDSMRETDYVQLFNNELRKQKQTSHLK